MKKDFNLSKETQEFAEKKLANAQVFVDEVFVEGADGNVSKRYVKFVPNGINWAQDPIKGHEIDGPMVTLSYTPLLEDGESIADHAQFAKYMTALRQSQINAREKLFKKAA